MNARRARPPTRVDAIVSVEYQLLVSGRRDGVLKLRKDLVDVKLRKRAYGKEWVLVEKKKSKKSKK